MLPSLRLAAAFAAVILSLCASSPAHPAGVEQIHFPSHNTELAGTIVWPRGKIEAGTVFVHGSGPQSRNLGLARAFASQGIAALVYDKRGAGQSGGEYVQFRNISETNLHVLANDAAAALNHLAGHNRMKDVPSGFTGISQAGWIVPLAAEKTSAVKYIALWSGPVCKLSEEDLYSQYTSDRDFQARPPFEEVRALRKEPYVWDKSCGRDIDPIDSLVRLRIPGFWIFGDNDGSIPTDLSIARLKKLQSEGREEYDYALFSGVGHDAIDATFHVMTAWIKNTAKAPPRPVKSPPAARDLDQYVGTYTLANPSVKLLITLRESKLVAEAKGSSLELTHLANHSFHGHAPGEGFIFLDFSPATGTVIASESGQTYTLQKAPP